MVYKAIPKDFFVNLKTQKNAKIDNDDIIPFQFSKNVLSGKEKVKVGLSKNECVDEVILF